MTRSSSAPFIAFMLSLLLPLRGEDGVIEVPFEETSDFFLDPGALNGKCLAASLLTDTGTLFELESPELPSGAYRVHIRLKVSHTISEHTSRLAFQLAAQNPANQFGRELTIIAFERPGRYQDFSIPILIDDRAQWMKFSLTWNWRAAALKKRPPEPVKPPKIETEATLEVEEEEVEVLERKLSDLPYHMAVDRVWLEPLGDITVYDFTVDKLRYRPGEKVSISGTVRNFSERERNVQVSISIFRDMNEENAVRTETLILAPESSQAFAIESRLDDPLWGHEARCVITEKGKVLTRASEYFTVHNNPWAVAIGGFSTSMTVSHAGPDEASALQNAIGRKKQYLNLVEFVFWAPDDFGDLNPTAEYWSGQLRNHNSAESTKRLTDAFHKVGIACSVYAKLGTPGGKAGYEVLRKHPEWYRPDFYDVAQLDRWDRSPEMRSWPQLTVRRDIRESYEHHADEIIKSVKRFGWDIIRYDSHMMWKETGDILRLVKGRVNKAYPHVQWGYNDNVHRSGNQPPPTSASWAQNEGNEKLKPVYDLLCENGGMIMDEYNLQAGLGRWSYQRYGGRQVSIRDGGHSRGGHVIYCPF